MSPLSQYVQALADTIPVKIKNNLLQPRSLWQTGEQIFTLSNCIALAVIKEGATWRGKLGQSWRYRWLCNGCPASPVQERECYVREEIPAIYHFLFWEGMKTTENLSLKFSQKNYFYQGLFSAFRDCKMGKAELTKLPGQAGGAHQECHQAGSGPDTGPGKSPRANCAHTERCSCCSAGASPPPLLGHSL